MEIEPDQLEVEEPASLEDDTAKCSTPEPILPEDVSTATSTSTGSTAAGNRQHFATFLKNLVNCVNKELIDSAAIEFLLNLNTKNNRKKLTTTIFGVKR